MKINNKQMDKAVKAVRAKDGSLTRYQAAEVVEYLAKHTATAAEFWYRVNNPTRFESGVWCW